MLGKKQLRQLILTLNTLNMKKTALPIDNRHIKKYQKGLEFISITLWKIYLILSNKKFTVDQKLYLLQLLPDPNNIQFINKNLAIWIYKNSSLLLLFYNKKTINQYTPTYGGANKQYNIDDITEIATIVISPLKYAEDKYGTIITIPLEITTTLVMTMSSVSQLLNSSLVETRYFKII